MKTFELEILININNYIGFTFVQWMHENRHDVPDFSISVVQCCDSKLHLSFDEVSSRYVKK